MTELDLLLVNEAQKIISNVTLKNLKRSKEKILYLVNLAEDIETKDALEKYPEALLANL